MALSDLLLGGRYVLQPGLSDAEIKSFADRLPGPLPVEIASLLTTTSGFEAPEIGTVDFLGRHPFEFAEAFPHGLPIAGDGEGNYWLQDVRGDTGSWEKVFFVSHDPQAIVVAATSLEDFVAQVNSGSSVVEFSKRAVERIWRSESVSIDLSTALSSPDDVLKTCAQTLGEGSRIMDLRDADVGSGFAIRSLSTLVTRCSPEPVFGIKD